MGEAVYPLTLALSPGNGGEGKNRLKLAQLSQLRAEFQQNEKSLHANSSGLNTGLSETSENGL
jgi:hypothetical protein